MLYIGMLLVIIGVIIGLFYGIKLAIVAFKESTAWGLIYLFVPFASIFYIITRWEKCKPLFLRSLLSIPFYVVGMMMLPGGLSSLA